MNSNHFQTYVIGADAPIGQYLMQILNAQSLPCKGIGLESRDKLSSLSSGRPFFVIIPPPDFAVSQSDIEFWMARARDIDACTVLLSSTAVFRYQANVRYEENDDVYDDTELAAMLRNQETLTAENPHHLILRTGQVFACQSNDFVSDILNQARQNKVLKLDMQRLFDPTPADDVADVLLAVMRQLHCSDDVYGTYHFSGADAVSAYSFAEAALAEAGQYEDFSHLVVGSEEGGGYLMSGRHRPIIHACFILSGSNPGHGDQA